MLSLHILVLTIVPTAFAASGGYVQLPGPGNASFTMYTGCSQPACGVAANGFTAAISQLAFGSAPGIGPGISDLSCDACGRCFSLTGNHDPFSPSYTGPFGKTIVVKVTDMCPVAGNQEWCGQTATSANNQHGMPVHFDICQDTGGAAQFFPSGHGALTGTFQEVSCSSWSGSDGSPLWNGACISGESAPLWPSTGCGNQGLAPGASGQQSSINQLQTYDGNDDDHEYTTQHYWLFSFQVRESLRSMRRNGLYWAHSLHLTVQLRCCFTALLLTMSLKMIEQLELESDTCSLLSLFL
ncbi:Endoglucanase V-like protein [Mycena indigotica]|uniref:Endoglucanase V-like protein n=1 Tax=Mycena indigotica TaxID=2126181 RepID=A0A8H6T205_9AGAR|nr:Endoglucanase V-like protein [Mycena indigotica]KAF7309576.1 Endoglucanase V-like protein [Mycena indigotica]